MSNLILPTIPGLDIAVERAQLYSTVEQTTLTRQRIAYTYETYPLYRYTLNLNLLRSLSSKLEFQQLVGFLARHSGSFDNFLFSDPEDNAVAAHGFGVGDGVTTQFQLQRSLDALGAGVYDVLGGPWGRSSKPRTNLCIQSQAFENVAWAKTSIVSVTTAAAVAPDNTQTGEKLVEAAASSAHYVEATNIALTSGSTYTFSVFAKAKERTTLVLVETLVGSQATFDLAAGLTSGASGCTSAIISCGNGWYRCSITFTPGSTGNDYCRVYVNLASAYLGDGTSGLYIWGAQVEQASLATPYISTTSTAVTVNPLYWSAVGEGFEPIFDTAPGETILVNGTAKVSGTDYTLASGLVTFTSAPAASAVLSWTGSYYRRVRFEKDDLPTTRLVQSFWEAKRVSLVSLKGTGVNLVSTPLLPRTETPSGTINGTTGSDGNATFTLSRAPLTNTPVNVYLRGARLQLTTEYTVSGQTITMLAPKIPLTGDVLTVDYYAY